MGEASKGRQTAPESFGSLREVQAYLEAAGKPVSLSWLKYRSARGLLAMGKDLRWPKAAVDALAKTIPAGGARGRAKPKDAPAPKPGRSRRPADLGEEKLRREISRIEASAERLERQHARRRRRLMAREEAWAGLACAVALAWEVVRAEFGRRAPGAVEAMLSAVPAQREEALARRLEDDAAWALHELSRSWSVAMLPLEDGQEPERRLFRVCAPGEAVPPELLDGPAEDADAGPLPKAASGSLAEAKTCAEIRRLRIQEALIRLDTAVESGELLPMAATSQAMAARLAELKAAVEQDASGLAPELARRFGGGQKGAAEAFAQAFEGVLGRGLRRFSRPWTADELGPEWDEGQPEELLEGRPLP